jgi:hypothetical protein
MESDVRGGMKVNPMSSEDGSDNWIFWVRCYHGDFANVFR